MSKERPKQPEKKAANPSSLRGYWTKMDGLPPDSPSQPRRRAIPPGATPSLGEQSTLLDVPAVPARPPGEENTQPVQAILPDAEPESVAEGKLLPLSPTPQLLRERLQRKGVASLSNAELVSVVLHTDQESEHMVPTINTLLDRYSVAQLLRVDFGELCEQYGLGEVKTAQLQAMLEVARRLTLPSEEIKHKIFTPADAALLVRSEMEFLDHEELRVLLLDTKSQVLADLLLYQGTINSSVLRIAEIFRPAITRKCSGIIVCHNHPSGDPTPSQEDYATTQLLVEAGNVLDVELLDHLIIGSNGRFVSLKTKMQW